jgi:hypothetical protein
VKFYQGKVAAAFAERDKAIFEVRTSICHCENYCKLYPERTDELVKYILN